MAAWALKDAKESFDTVFERASGGEPQIITRGGTPLWVVVSYMDYDTKSSRADMRGNDRKVRRKSFVDALLSCPRLDEGETLDISRDSADVGRTIEL